MQECKTEIGPIKTINISLDLNSDTIPKMIREIIVAVKKSHCELMYSTVMNPSKPIAVVNTPRIVTNFLEDPLESTYPSRRVQIKFPTG